MRTDSAPPWLAALLAPVPVDEFLAKHWRTRHLYCRGSAERFHHLLSWTTLNAMLEHHWRETYRFRLACQGRDLDPASYADLSGFTPKVRARELTDHLRRGATLSFDAIDELHDPLTRLAESFERFFRGGTKINVYAGWRALHGLDLHRDNQEIFILQLEGRKRWLLYGSSVDGLNLDDLRRSSAPPPGAAFDQIVEPGDLLYIPRGCYHIALPINEPSLHLTLGVKNPRGMDLLLWMTERLRATEIADRDLPVLADEDERLRYSDSLRQALTQGLQPDLVDQYLSDTGSNLKPRPSFSLPWSATLELLPAGQDFTITLHVNSPLSLSGPTESDSLELRCGGRQYRFPHSMRAMVEALDVGASVPMARLLDTIAGRLDEETVRLLLGMLLQQGLIAIAV